MRGFCRFGARNTCVRSMYGGQLSVTMLAICPKKENVTSVRKNLINEVLYAVCASEQLTVVHQLDDVTFSIYGAQLVEL